MIALRGAITVEEDVPELIYEATNLLIGNLVESNGLSSEEIVSVIFSCTKDLRSAYPAVEVRRMGIDVPLFCLQEMDVEGSLAMTIRVLMHVERSACSNVRHVYLRRARTLRPDLVSD